ncbi:MAG: EAL domain-containing protein [Pseudomonadota bacterium]
MEDRPLEAEIAVRQLEAAGIKCKWERVDTEPSFRVVLTRSRPDLILSDFTLPEFDGLSALEIARAMAPHVPFIFLSGTIGEERAIEALQRGAVDYVLKTNMARLAPAVRRALADAAAKRSRRVLERRLHEIVATSQDWIWEQDREGRFTFCSASVRHILGYTPESLLGEPAAKFVHPDDVDALERATRALVPNDPSINNLSARWRHKDGSFRFLERNAFALFDSRGTIAGLRGTERDVTQRRQQEAHIARLTRVLRMLSGINSSVLRINERHELLAEACRLATVIGGYVTAVVSLIVPGTRTAKPEAWSGSVDQGYLESEVYDLGDAGSAGPSVVSGALRSGAPVVLNDLAIDDVPREARSALLEADFRCAIGIPLIVDGTAIGVFVLTSHDAVAVSAEETQLLRELCANLSFALQYLHKEDEVRFLSYFDPLTGLAKRALYCERVMRLLQPGVDHSGNTTVVVFDIEKLSSINDSFGRHGGDQLLQMVADRAKRYFENTDRLAHFGGGTFALTLQPEDREAEATHWVQQHLSELLRAPFTVEGHSIPVAVKLGIASYPANGADANTLVQNAEAALQAAKASGEQYMHHRLELSSKGVSRLAMEHRLRGAIERQEFDLFYQPKVDIRTRMIRGLEALVRWRDPDAGLVSPAEFLPLLESSGMIVTLGEWIQRRAAGDVRHWKENGFPPVRVAVNISPVQLRRRSFVDQFLESIGEWPDEQWGIDIEITEGALLDDVGTVVSKLRSLRQKGVRVAIDDFGTGYSSLSRLAKLPIDLLKIDRTFINEMAALNEGRTIVETIVALGRTLGMTTVAEGVETVEQFGLLEQLGCDQSQGYLHCRPAPIADIDAMLMYAHKPFVLPKR